MIETKPSDTMRDLGIVQSGAQSLCEQCGPLELPAERGLADTIVSELTTVMDRVREAHDFAKGSGIAAPQIGIHRRVAVVQPPDENAPIIVMLNPRIVSRSEAEDEQYEGCLSFFDVRGLVPRPLSITVEAATPTGETTVTEYRDGLARLIHHEIDHLDGILYTARMRVGAKPIPVEQYRQTGHSWVYDQQ
ncbi:peptide deformylase [Nocardia iowensis]|uniref:Peptide deformylase n=1 Tax=Nocardia iowensis TaxID=204891 RepID=A0ABX8S0Z9_NOCIO|nr:peptide deformylase [Nocardia iowensis]QXN94744.1 peptide deformylase [Nocardia iowensis]